VEGLVRREGRKEEGGAPRAGGGGEEGKGQYQGDTLSLDNMGSTFHSYSLVYSLIIDVTVCGRA